jgi:ATP-dependent DNA helicase UvrD/PcrA
MKFTETQRQAIEHAGGNLQLIACAGSGKTEVVARRVVHLLTPGTGAGLEPRNIIAFTFTEKAAAELKERIISRVRGSLGEIAGLAEMFVGTIHAFALEMLKSEVPKYLKYEVLNEVQQSLFVDRHSKQSGLTACTDLQGVALKRYRDTQYYLTAMDILREADLDEAALTGCSLLDGQQAYSTLLDERSYLDYSAILENAVYHLTDDDLRARLAERVRYVIVDEYQDVNPIQEAIVWSLHELGAKICVVGDDDQTIYQWRGSDVENILTFDSRYAGVERISLEENFRSSDGVVETARDFIAQNTARLPKAMKPTSAQTYEPGDIVALSFDSPDEEARYIAETAQTLRGVAIQEDDTERGISWSDMAVLLRSVKANAEPIIRALDAAAIPFVVVGMANLFSTPEAEAAGQLFYFMAARAGVDEAAVERAWQSANLGIKAADLGRAIENIGRARASLSEPDQKRWGLYSIQRLFLSFLEDTGIREERVPNGRGEVVFYNLGKFSQVIKAFRDTWALGIHSYLSYLDERLYLCRELLADSGSLFVQINDENVHRVRVLMDEVFGAHNFCSIIPFRKKTMPLGAKVLEQMHDFLLWYARRREDEQGNLLVKFRQLYLEQDVQGDFHWNWYELPDGTRHRMTTEENSNHALLPPDSRVYRLVSMYPPTYSEKSVFPFEFEG